MNDKTIWLNDSAIYEPPPLPRQIRRSIALRIAILFAAMFGVIALMWAMSH